MSRPAWPATRLLSVGLGIVLGAGGVHAADPVRGADLYNSHCASCHGAQGRPQLPAAPDLAQPTALLKPDLTLLASIRTGRGAMPAFQGLLRDRDILDIVAHMRTFR